jgi:hypothetical protein
MARFSTGSPLSARLGVGVFIKTRSSVMITDTELAIDDNYMTATDTVELRKFVR